MISLATRGYLWMLGVGGAQVFGPGPAVSDAKSIQPEMRGSAFMAPPGPGISGGGITGPVISGGSAAPTTPAAEPPSIVGGGPMRPGVGK